MAGVLGLRNQLDKASQMHDPAAANRDRLQAEVERLVAETAKASDAHRAELSRLVEEHGGRVSAKDAELKTAADKSTQLDWDLESCGRAWALRGNRMLAKVQHLNEAFVHMCFFPSPLPDWCRDPTKLSFVLLTFLFLC